MANRLLTAVLTGAFAAALLCAAPPPASAKVIGVIYPECCDAYDSALKNFKTELAKGGFGSGDLEIYEQKPSADPMSWTNAFRKFVGVDADLIVVFGDDMLEVACREKTKIPVVFGFVGNPTRSGCVKSEDAPGGNVTGVTSRAPLFTLLDKAKKVTMFSTLGVFDLEGDVVAASALKETEAIARDLGFRVVPLRASSRGGLAEAFGSAAAPDMLFMPSFAAGTGPMTDIAASASAKGVPVISLRPAEAGMNVLLSLYPNPEEQGALMGQMAVRLLKGESPAKMKVEAPKKIEFEINIAAARKLDLKVPMSVLETATRVNK